MSYKESIRPDWTYNLSAVAGECYDAIIIGSGPAGTAAAQTLAESHSDWKIAILERGPIRLMSHAWNLREVGLSHPLYLEQATCPWVSSNEYFTEPVFVPSLGGRSSFWGCWAPRFTNAEFKERWPITLNDLETDYEVAEKWLSVTRSGVESELQLWAKGCLETAGYDSQNAPLALDTAPTGNRIIARGFDSAIARLVALATRDHYERGQFAVIPDTFVSRLVHDGQSVQAVECIDTSMTSSSIFYLRARYFLLAASTIESARIVLNSHIPDPENLAGRHLVTHLLCQASFEIPASEQLLRQHSLSQTPGCAVLARIPEFEGSERSFQIQLQDGWQETLPPPRAGPLRLWLRVFGAVESQYGNRVSLDLEKMDALGIPRARVHFSYSLSDWARVKRMRETLINTARILGGEVPEEHVLLMPAATVNHEAGTLSMTKDKSSGVINAVGQHYHMPNLFVCDASLFSSSGVANPYLTITALARRVARNLPIS